MQSNYSADVNNSILTHYEVLKISRNASFKDIKKEAQTALKQWHPNNSMYWMKPEDHTTYADAMIRRVYAARDTLLDEMNRRNYDKLNPVFTEDEISFAANWRRLNKAYMDYLKSKTNDNHNPQDTAPSHDHAPNINTTRPASPVFDYPDTMFGSSKKSKQFMKVFPQGLLCVRKQVVMFGGEPRFINIELAFDEMEHASNFVQAWNKISRDIIGGIELHVNKVNREQNGVTIAAPINLSAKFKSLAEINGEILLQELNTYAEISGAVPQEFWWRQDVHGVRRKMYDHEIREVRVTANFKIN